MNETKYYDFWHLHIAKFNERVGHHPDKTPDIRIMDMKKANGPRCKTKRVWVYFKATAWLIDWY